MQGEHKYGSNFPTLAVFLNCDTGPRWGEWCWVMKYGVVTSEVLGLRSNVWRLAVINARLQGVALFTRLKAFAREGRVSVGSLSQIKLIKIVFLLLQITISWKHLFKCDLYIGQSMYLIGLHNIVWHNNVQVFCRGEGRKFKLLRYGLKTA